MSGIRAASSGAELSVLAYSRYCTPCCIALVLVWASLRCLLWHFGSGAIVIFFSLRKYFIFSSKSNVCGDIIRPVSIHPFWKLCKSWFFSERKRKFWLPKLYSNIASGCWQIATVFLMYVNKVYVETLDTGYSFRIFSCEWVMMNKILDLWVTGRCDNAAWCTLVLFSNILCFPRSCVSFVASKPLFFSEPNVFLKYG